jgi:hypothetical protein
MQKSVNERDMTAIPRAALVLGLGGLIPFLAIPLLVLVGQQETLPVWLRAHTTVPALVLYAAVILSFMGGVQWGIAVRSVDEDDLSTWRRYGVSVLPALLAWFAVFTATRTALILLATGFVALLIYDLWMVARDEAPKWYERLRVMLTSVVVIALTGTVVLLT